MRLLSILYIYSPNFAFAAVVTAITVLGLAWRISAQELPDIPANESRGVVGCIQTNTGTFCPRPSVPSDLDLRQAAEISRKRRLFKTNDDALDLWARRGPAAALPTLREALKGSSGDRTIALNVAYAEAEVAFSSGDLDSAIERIREATHLGEVMQIYSTSTGHPNRMATQEDLGERLAYFKREQERALEQERSVASQRAIAESDAKLTAAIRGVTETEKARWAEPPSPHIALATGPGGQTSQWASAAGNLESFVSGVFNGATPYGGLLGTVSSSAEAGGIYSRFAVGVASDTMSAVDALAKGDEATASAKLGKVEQRARSVQQDTNGFVQEQFSGSAGSATVQVLLKK
jgi:hypothetical protein